MKTVDDLIREIESPAANAAQQNVKTASVGSEAGTAPASTEGVNMGLLELYNSQYGTAESVKTAAPAQQPQQVKHASMQKTAEEIRLEKLGSAARQVFDAQLNDFLFKFAAEDIASREADMSVPGVGDPQLPVNRPADASAPVNTTPQYHDEQHLSMSQDQEALIAEIENVVNARTHGGSLVTTQEQPAAQLR
jgi:hypothetical protein